MSVIGSGSLETSMRHYVGGSKEGTMIQISIEHHEHHGSSRSAGWTADCPCSWAVTEKTQSLRMGGIPEDFMENVCWENTFQVIDRHFAKGSSA